MSQISSGNAVIDARLAELLAGGVSLFLFSVPFKLRFEFAGEVACEARGTSVVFTGEAKLSEPFMVTTRLAVTIDGAGRHELRFGVAELDRVLEKHVRGRLEAGSRATFDRLVRPYVAPFRECVAIVASHAGEDRALGPIGVGANFYREVEFAAVEPTRALAGSFPRAQLEQRRLPLHIGCAAGATFVFVIEGAAAIAAELGTPVVQLDALSLRVTQASTTPVEAAAVEFTLYAGGEARGFAGSLVDAGGRTELVGRLETDAGTWSEPFGARGVALTSVRASVRAHDAAPHVRVELSAGVRIGGRTVDAIPRLLLDAAAPERSVMQIVSAVATDLKQLLAALVDLRHLPSELTSLPFDDYVLSIAPNGGSFAGDTYATGLSLRGELDLWGWRAAVAGALSYTEGGYLHGSMSPIVFPSEGWLVNIRGEGDAGPMVAIDFSASKQAVHVVAAAKIVTRFNYAFELVIDRERLKVLLGKTKLGIYAGGVLEVERGKLSLTATTSFRGRCRVPLGRASFELDADIAATYRGTGTREAVRQDVEFHFDACGAALHFAANAGTLQFAEVESLAVFFAKQGERIGQLVAAELLRAPLAAIAWLQSYLPDARQMAMVARDVGLACEAAADGLRQVYGLTAEACATSLRVATYSTTAIAGAMVSAYAMTEREVGVLLDKIGVPAKDIAKAMHKAFDWSAEKTAEFCSDALDLGDKATRNALEAADYSSKEIKGAMKDVFGWTESMWDSFVDLF